MTGNIVKHAKSSLIPATVDELSKAEDDSDVLGRPLTLEASRLITIMIPAITSSKRNKSDNLLLNRVLRFPLGMEIPTNDTRKRLTMIIDAWRAQHAIARLAFADAEEIEAA